MAMVIKNNMSAQMALGALNKNSNKLSKQLQKVGSGMKINSAEDDASGYAISERMRVQIRGLGQDIDNTQNAISMLRTAEGAASSTVDILKTLKEKAINAANDTNTDADRATIQKEVDQSIDQIDDNANVTFNGKTLFDGSADVADDVKQTIIKALNSEWIARSLNMVKDAYGMSFFEDHASVKEIELNFTDEDSDVLASVSSISVNGVANSLTLNINLHFYENLDPNDVNGSSSTGEATYLDRTLAHELTHAVMRANISDMDSLPKYIREGSAEFIHGIDDERKGTLAGLTSGAGGTVASTLADSENASGSLAYAVGYAFLHYINKVGGHEDAMKRFMAVLDEKGGTAYDEAISAATKGRFNTASEAETAFKNDFDSYLSDGHTINEFYKAYCDIDLENTRDTGSVKGSKAWGGDEENAEDVVLEGKSTRFWYYPSGSTSTIEGLTVKWGDFSRPDSGFRFQVGTKANQQIKAAFSDIHAQALGLLSDEGETVQLTTRANAKRALTIFDNALQKVLDQQTTIGSIQSRLNYTAQNLTTAQENVTSSESTIRDADMAKEMTEYTKANVLTQAAQSMLAQANQSSSGVLSLLQ
ncbi:putative flagellin [Selenomonas ruminantium subsp. lactilytica TAM6421]|uniref:Flagellin n=1 Tax=Selenomonas ruminantium subsp. lactilytica (strain NBRC 103574 / TAM6421) TaxID=927704 RepID=I0GTU7_SELRL|nr:flagellinolysin [Selenomonas ruminantium]BAL84184.1 putative flagellin [Selenomonas ruminantium subsp. lactilytica TAM6421]